MGVLDFFLIIVAFCAFLKITNAGVIPFENSVVADSKNSSSEILPTYASNRFLHGLLASLYVIVISELGDKTFFIAAILSIDHPRLVVYTGAMAALATMTVLSALVGHATEVIPRIYTFYMSGFLFIIFGLKMLKDGNYLFPIQRTLQLIICPRRMQRKNSRKLNTNFQVKIPLFLHVAPRSGISFGGSCRLFSWRHLL